MGFFYFYFMNIFISGATAGIGRACAELYAKNGHNIIVTGRRKDRLESLATALNQYNVSIVTLCFDMNDHAEMISQVSEVISKTKIDVLINNAGLALGKDHLADARIDDLDKMLDTNVKSLLKLTKLIIPDMITNKSGHIINLSSVAGSQSYAGGIGYCASKYAVDAITKTLRIELAPYSIRVGSISPGMVETEFSEVRFKGDKTKAKAVYEGIKPLNAEDIASCIFWMTSLPPHICINDINLTPTGQADALHIFRNT